MVRFFSKGGGGGGVGGARRERDLLRQVRRRCRVTDASQDGGGGGGGGGAAGGRSRARTKTSARFRWERRVRVESCRPPQSSPDGRQDFSLVGSQRFAEGAGAGAVFCCQTS